MDHPPCCKSYPRFHPHITLASGIPPSAEVTAVLACLPEVAPVSVEFQSLEVGDTYFRSLYVAIRASPSLAALHQSIHDDLRKLEGVEPQSPCFPHMSLFYINEVEPDERRMVADELLRSGRVVKEQNKCGIILDCSVNPTGEVQLSGFDGKEIWLVGCEGAVELWTVLDKVILQG